MREGELFISVTGKLGGAQIPYPIGIPSVYEQMPGIPLVSSGEGPFWREHTGQKKGLLVKRAETQTLKISGLRCIKCGYTELYARK
ncbi:MAG: hypothetical protein V1850_01710 [Candidatus Bathyarchaeota archaeon]